MKQHPPGGGAVRVPDHHHGLGVYEVNGDPYGDGGRQTGQALAAGGEEYYSVFLSNPVPMAVLDEDGHLIAINTAARAVLSTDSSPFRYPVEGDLPRGDAPPVSFVLHSENGDLPIGFGQTPLKWNGAKATLLTFRDDTELMEARRRLEQQETRLSLALRGARVGTWMGSPMDHSISVDEQWAAMIGYEAQELGSDIREVFLPHIHPEDQERVMDYIRRLSRGEQGPMDIEFRMVHRNGQDVWVRSMGRPVAFGEGGAPCRIAGVHIDITRDHASRDALYEANRKLSILSSITRHDIMNELSVILMCEDLMAMDGLPEDGSEYTDYLELIFRATKKIERQILFTRDYDEMGISEPAWNRVRTQAGRAVRLLCPEGVAIQVQTGEVEVYADPMFEKVLHSLFENAVRHGSGVSMVRVTFSERDGNGVLAVSDNGRGVAKGEKKRIFERGYGENTGYGLFLSREILSLTGIAITECGIPGEGACFEMVIPAGRFRYAVEEEQAPAPSGFDDIA
jgi:PAS domain S-box-containing protein